MKLDADVAFFDLTEEENHGAQKLIFEVKWLLTCREYVFADDVMTACVYIGS